MARQTWGWVGGAWESRARGGYLSGVVLYSFAWSIPGDAAPTPGHSWLDQGPLTWVGPIKSLPWEFGIGVGGGEGRSP